MSPHKCFPHAQLHSCSYCSRGMASQLCLCRVHVHRCMSFPLHVLSAVALPAVTSTRVGADYDWPSNCNIGVSSFLPWAMGLRPSKDSFMSSNRSKVVMGPPFVRNGTGGNPMALPELNAVVSALGSIILTSINLSSLPCCLGPKLNLHAREENIRLQLANLVQHIPTPWRVLCCVPPGSRVQHRTGWRRRWPECNRPFHCDANLRRGRTTSAA